PHRQPHSSPTRRSSDLSHRVAGEGGNARSALTREAVVVGNERQPRDGHRDHQVDARPEGKPPSPGALQAAPKWPDVTTRIVIQRSEEHTSELQSPDHLV